MTRKKSEPLKNVPASVKARLLALSKDQGEQFNSLLTRYVLERFLHRLATSSHASNFLLKGALLFTVWAEKPHRVTRDIDEAPAKLAQWKGFVGRTLLSVEAPSLKQASEIIGSLVLPVFHRLAEGRAFDGVWPARGPWRFDAPPHDSQ